MNTARTLALLLLAALTMAIPIVAVVAAILARVAARRLERRVRELSARMARLEEALAARAADSAGAPSVAPQEPAPVTPVPGEERRPAAESVPADVELPGFVEAGGPPPEEAPPLPPAAPPAEPRRALRFGPVDLEQRIGARWTTWVGVLAIVVSIGFLLRWSFEMGLVGPEGRVAIGLVSGAAMLAGGLALGRRGSQPFLSSGLTGGGLAAFYLSFYAAHATYALIGSAVAFGAMCGVTAAGAAIAVITSRPSTAVLAVVGGLLTPILVTTERPNETVLLAYLLVLDLLVLAVASRRSWHGLNRLAWAGTVLLLTPIFSTTRPAEDPWIRLALLTAIFSLFLAVPLARSWIERRAAEALDLFVIAGNAATYTMSVILTLRPWWSDAEASFALLLATLYVVVGSLHSKRVPGDERTEMVHLGVATVLGVIAIPLALDGPWVTLAWAAMGTVFFVLSPSIPRTTAITGGLLCFALAVFRVTIFDWTEYRTWVRVWNVRFAVHLAVVVALAWSGQAVARWDDRATGRDLRRLLWVAASLLLTLLLWREPRGMWPAVLLTLELLALAWLANVFRDSAFVVASSFAAGALIVRMLLLDGPLAWAAAKDLVNGPLVVRVAAAVALALAGSWLARSGAGPLAVGMGRVLAAAGWFTGLVSLSLGWTNHLQQQVNEAISEGMRTAIQRLRWQHQVGVSVLWTLYAAGTLASGFLRASSRLRYVGLTLLAVTILKVFLVDLSSVQAVYRVVSFLVLGLVLLGVSYVYQRWRRNDSAPS